MAAETGFASGPETTSSSRATTSATSSPAGPGETASTPTGATWSAATANRCDGPDEVPARIVPRRARRRVAVGGGPGRERQDRLRRGPRSGERPRRVHDESGRDWARTAEQRCLVPQLVAGRIEDRVSPRRPAERKA